MPSVDDRIVRMHFDNAEFERKVKSTIAVLTQLNESLKMEGATKGLQNINDAVSKLKFDPLHQSIQRVSDSIGAIGKSVSNVNLTKMVDNLGVANSKVLDLNSSLGETDDSVSPVSVAIDGVSAKFAALATIAATTLATITNMALASAKNIVSAFSFDGLQAGFQEYETNIGSVQTILANTSKEGTKLVDVNKALDTLNDYSDKTIYNFGQMVSNIGRFTTAGVKLDTSVSAIKGLSNVAALSGSNAEQAASSMYQLSQALSSGVVKLKDWISVENAGMAGPLFQEALFETGKAMKTLTDVPIGKTFDQWKEDGNNFRDSLSDGWLTADVLSQTLTALTGDLDAAGIAALGYSDAQAEQLAKLAQLGLDSATSVRTFSQLMNTLKEAVGSGWSATFRLIVGDFEQATKTFSGAYNFFAGLISRSADARNAVLKDWQFAGGRNALFGGFSNAVVALTISLGKVKEAFRDVFPRKSGFELAQLTKKFEMFMFAIIPGPKALENIKRTARGFFAVLSIGWEIIKGFVGIIWDLFKAIGRLGTGPLLETTATFGDVLFNIQQALVKGGGIAKIFDGIREAVSALAGVVGPVASKIKEFITNLFPDKISVKGPDIQDRVDSFVESIQKLSISTDKIEDIGDKIVNFFTSFDDSISGFGKGAGGILNGIIDGISDFFSGIGDAIASENTDKILKGMELGLFAGIAVMIGKFIKNFSFGKLLFGDTFTNLNKSMLEFTDTLKAMQTNLKSNTLLKIAIAIGVLAAAFFVLTTIPADKLRTAALTMGGMFAALIGSMKALEKITRDMDTTKVLATGASLVFIAGSILILAFALRKIAGIDRDEVAGGLLVIAAALTALTIAVRKMDGADMRNTGIQLLFLSAALYLMAFSLEKIGNLDDDQIAKGGVTLAAALAAIVVAVRAMDGSDLKNTGIQLLFISGALLVFAFALEKIGNLDDDQIAKGGATLAVAFAAIVAGVRAMDKADLKNTGIQILFIAGALLVFATAVKMLGEMDDSALLRGALTLGLAFAAIVAGVKLLEGKDIGVVGKNILIIAGAMFIVAAAIALLAQLPIDKLLISLGVLLGAIVLIGLISFAMTRLGVTPMIIALGIALGVFAGALLIAAAAAYVFARAFQIIGEQGPIAIDNMRKAIIEFGGLIPELAKDFAEGMIELLNTIADNMPMIVDRLVEIGMELIKGFAELVGPMEDVIGLILDAILNVINTYVPQIVAAGVLIILSLAEGIRQVVPQLAADIADIILNILSIMHFYLPQIVAAGVQLLTDFLNGIALAIPQVAGAVGNIIVAFITAIGNETQRVIDAGVQLILDMIQGIVDAQIAIVSALSNAILGFFNAVADEGIDFADSALKIVIDFLNDMAAVIRERDDQVVDAAFNLGHALIEAMEMGIRRAAEELFGNIPIIGGQVVKVFKEVWEVFSPSRVFLGMGEDLMAGLAIGIDKGSDDAVSAAQSVGRTTINAMNEAINAASNTFDSLVNTNPVITPVIDLTSVEQGAASVNDLLQNGSLNPRVSFDAASSIARTQLNQPLSPEQNPASSGNVNFEQNIYAPEQLSTADIYKQTRNQIAMAKEELKIP